MTNGGPFKCNSLYMKQNVQQWHPFLSTCPLRYDFMYWSSDHIKKCMWSTVLFFAHNVCH